MSNKLANEQPPDPARGSSSREAVEGAIDLSKDDKFTTWEESAQKGLARIPRWETIKKRSPATVEPATR